MEIMQTPNEEEDELIVATCKACGRRYSSWAFTHLPGSRMEHHVDSSSQLAAPAGGARIAPGKLLELRGCACGSEVCASKGELP
jgi:hypothetical protein